MKAILRAAILLILGGAIGWYFGRNVSRDWVRTELTRALQVYPPEFANYMESWADVIGEMDRDEIDTLLNHIKIFANQQVNDIRASTLHEAVLAEILSQRLEAGETNEVMEIIVSKRRALIDAVDNGDFVGTEREEFAARMALLMKERNRQQGDPSDSSPATGSEPGNR